MSALRVLSYHTRAVLLYSSSPGLRESLGGLVRFPVGDASRTIGLSYVNRDPGLLGLMVGAARVLGGCFYWSLWLCGL